MLHSLFSFRFVVIFMFDLRSVQHQMTTTGTPSSTQPSRKQSVALAPDPGCLTLVLARDFSR